jgi:hypothetical protein
VRSSYAVGAKNRDDLCVITPWLARRQRKRRSASA